MHPACLHPPVLPTPRALAVPTSVRPLPLTHPPPYPPYPPPPLPFWAPDPVGRRPQAAQDRPHLRLPQDARRPLHDRQGHCTHIHTTRPQHLHLRHPHLRHPQKFPEASPRRLLGSEESPCALSHITSLVPRLAGHGAAETPRGRGAAALDRDAGDDTPHHVLSPYPCSLCLHPSLPH